MKHFSGLRDLSWLNLGGSHAADFRISEAAGHRNVVVLGLDETKVTAAGLRELAGLRTPTKLDLMGPSATSRTWVARHPASESGRTTCQCGSGGSGGGPPKRALRSDPSLWAASEAPFNPGRGIEERLAIG